MKRLLSLLPCGLALASAPSARGQTAAELDYIRARREAVDAYDRAQGTFNQKAALANLERKLRSILGPVNMPGFPQPGRINLEAICRGEEGCESLDGLLYRTEDHRRRFLVTTPVLMTNWLKGHRLSPDSALRTPRLFTDIFGSHAVVLHYANLTIPDAQRRGVASAMLVVVAQDEGKWPPDKVIVSVSRANRVYIIQVPPAVAIDTLEGCGIRLDTVFKAKPDPRQITMEEADRAYASYRACYSDRVSSIPGIDRIIDQVVRLVDALPPTAAKNYGLSDDAAIQGTWRVADARARMSNEPAMIIDGLIDRGTVEFSENTVTMRQLPHGDVLVHTFSLDTLGSPRRIRMIDTTAADGGRWTGLYRVTGDTLRLSLPISRDGSRPIPPASFNAPNTAAYILIRVPRHP
jgi:uncharacterized protein (TIGR03067 family)